MQLKKDKKKIDKQADIKMRTFQEYIKEGMYDPGMFIAFWLAGGPGSG